MPIRNQLVIEEITAGRLIDLELGGGARPRAGYFSVDLRPETNPDIVADLNCGLSFLPDNCVGNLYSRHTFEHVVQLDRLMQEIHRVCHPTAVITIIVPHFSNTYAMSDPTHVRFFGIYSMFYYVPEAHQPKRRVPNYSPAATFCVHSIELQFYRNGLLDFVFSPFMRWFANLNFQTQEFYERRLSPIFHAWEISFSMSVLKQSPTMAQRAIGK